MNQHEFELGDRARWQNDDGGWDVGHIVLTPHGQPMQIISPVAGRMTMIQRYYHQDLVAVRDYIVVTEPHHDG